MPQGDSVLSQQWRELHRTYEPSWTVPMIPRIRARVGVRDGWFAAHHGARRTHHAALRHRIRPTEVPLGICPSTASVHSSTVDGEEASICVLVVPSDGLG